MQQVRSNRDSFHEGGGGGMSASSTIGRTELSPLINEYTTSQRQCRKICLLLLPE